MFNPLDYPIIFEQPRLTTPLSAWQGHIPFAMFLIQSCHPQNFVELGTHAGASYCAFCQSVEKSKFDIKCFAVDTWQGDEHTNITEYGNNVLDSLREQHDPLYKSFSRLIKSTFDDAIPQFADGSIGLLHIDGFHSYEAVKHDFESWLPKMHQDGIVLFHDISVYQETFGVHRFWDEIKNEYPHFEFHHCNGLGVLALSENQTPLLNDFFHATQEQSDILRAFFRGVGNSFLEEKYANLSGEHNMIITSRAWKAISSVKKIIRPTH